MLSTIGRAAIRRIGGGTAPTNRALQSLWALQRADCTQSQSPRCYATATATKTAVKPKAKKAAPAKERTATKAKKPAAKKTAVKKKATPTKKPALKKKPAVKKKKPVLKKKPVVKEKTEEQKAKAEELKKKAELKVLKTKALLAGEPTALPTTAWVVMSAETLRAGKTSLKEVMSEMSARYKSLSPAELEGYNHTANQNKIANAATYKTWIESHTPDEIRVANNARRLLRRRIGTSKYRLLHDDRQPKRASSSLMLFIKGRHNSDDYKGVGDLPTVSKLIMEEWRNLPQESRSSYEERSAADRQRYIEEFKTVFKRDSQPKKSPTPALDSE